MANLVGTANDDLISAWPVIGVDDTISGLAGNDTIYGMGGNDLLQGDDGHDSLFGSSENDTMEGGSGNDTLSGEGGIDSLYGDAGDDMLRLGTWSGGSGGAAYGGDGNDMLIATLGAAVTLDGGADTDTVYLAWSFASPGVGDVLIDFSGSTKIVETAYGVVTSFDNVEAVSAFLVEGEHTVIGSSYADSITLYVGSGPSTVDLGLGNDTVWAMADVAHTIEGGGGTDVLRIDIAAGAPFALAVDPLTGAVTQNSALTISGFEIYLIVSTAAAQISFGSGNDSFYGGGGADYVLGGNGVDSLTSTSGNDTLSGDLGDDRLFGGLQSDQLDGGTGNDVLNGGGHNDILFGGDGSDYVQGARGADQLFGGDGNDRMRGFYDGNDTMTGGAGADRFIFDSSQWGFHQIADFESSVDRLELWGAAISVSAPPPGALDPALLSYGAAVGSQAQFVLTYDAATDESTLVWDDNGDATGGGLIGVVRFAGDVTLLSSDIFIL